MNTDSQTHMLQEMGFLKEQALDALKASGNDVNKAIAYLFGEVDASAAGPGTQEPPLVVEKIPNEKVSSVRISNPGEIPEFLGLYTSNASIDEATHYERPDSVNSMNHSAEILLSESENCKENLREIQPGQFSSSSSSSSLENDLHDAFLDEESYPENIKTELTNTAAVLSRHRDVKCWTPLLLILGHSSVFAKSILELESNLPLIKEVQRIVYFIQNFDKSKRWYVNTDALAEILEDGGPRGSYHDEEMVQSILEHLMRNEPALRPVFECLVQSLDEEILKELTVLDIDADSRCCTLYESLNDLFWQRDFEFLGRIKYKSVAPFVTFQLVADADSVCVPFQLQEEIYPEIYSDKAVSRVREEIHSIKRAQMAYQTLNRKLMDLNFFEGKKIDGLLSQTASVLNDTNPEASEDIRGLAELLDACRVTELDRQTRAKLDASPRRLTLFTEIIKDLPELRPYKLIGVILSDFKYFFRAGDTWIDKEADVTVDFDSVKLTVGNCQGPHLITLIYSDAKANKPLLLRVSDQESGTNLGGKEKCSGSSESSESSEDSRTSEDSGDSVVAENYLSPSVPSEGKQASEGERNLASACALMELQVREDTADSSSSTCEHNCAPVHLAIGSENAKHSLSCSTFLTDSPNNGTEKGTENADVLSEGRDELAKTKEAFVKRPRWEDAAVSAGTSLDAVEGAELDISTPRETIRVQQHVVQQFLQDEKNVPDAAL